MDDTISFFLSYAHDSPAHRKDVLNLSDKLVKLGIDCWIDQYVENSTPPNGWPHWMEEKTRLSKYVGVVCSEKFLDRFEKNTPAGVGLGGIFESTLIVNDLYTGSMFNVKFIPLIMKDGDKKYIPRPLQPYTYYCLDTTDGFDRLWKRITNQPLVVRPSLGKLTIPKQDDTDRESVSLELKSLEEVLPDIPEIIKEMTSGLKIVQTFYSLPITERFAIARELGVVNENESYLNSNRDSLCAQFLLRIKEKELLAQLWTKLFDETINPNPFKK